MPEQDGKVLMTVKLPEPLARPPKLEAVTEHLGLEVSDLDSNFGVVEVDPERRLFAIMVASERVAALSAAFGANAEGPFSDPLIAPYGPVKE